MYATLSPHIHTRPRRCRDMNREALEAFIRCGPGERARAFMDALSRLATLCPRERHERRRFDLRLGSESTP